MMTGVSFIPQNAAGSAKQRDLKVSSSEGRESPIIFWAVFMTLWRAFLPAAEPLTYHAVMQYSL